MAVSGGTDLGIFANGGVETPAALAASLKDFVEEVGVEATDGVDFVLVKKDRLLVDIFGGVPDLLPLSGVPSFSSTGERKFSSDGDLEGPGEMTDLRSCMCLAKELSIFLPSAEAELPVPARPAIP